MFIIFCINYLKENCLFKVNVTILMIKVNVYVFIMLCYHTRCVGNFGGLNGVNRSAIPRECRNCNGRMV